MLGMAPNSVLIYAEDLLVPHLGPLFRATHSLKYYPAEWSLTETLMLKKPSKLDYTATHDKLQDIMTWPHGVFDWAALHNCRFGLDKFQLLDFTRKHILHPFDLRQKIPTPQQILRLGDHHIPPKDTAKFLGMILDNMLSWNAQCAAALAKGQDWLFRFKRITMTTKGIHARQFHCLYLSTAIPIFSMLLISSSLPSIILARGLMPLVNHISHLSTN